MPETKQRTLTAKTVKLLARMAETQLQNDWTACARDIQLLCSTIEEMVSMLSESLGALEEDPEENENWVDLKQNLRAFLRAFEGGE